MVHLEGTQHETLRQLSTVMNGSCASSVCLSESMVREIVGATESRFKLVACDIKTSFKQLSRQLVLRDTSNQCTLGITPHSTSKPRMLLMRLLERVQACTGVASLTQRHCHPYRRSLWSDSVRASTTRKLRIRPVSEHRRRHCETRNSTNHSKPRPRWTLEKFEHYETLVRGNSPSISPTTGARLMTGPRMVAQMRGSRPF